MDQDNIILMPEYGTVDYSAAATLGELQRNIGEKMVEQAGFDGAKQLLEEATNA